MTAKYRIKIETHADGSQIYWVQRWARFLWWTHWVQVFRTDMEGSWPVGFSTLYAAEQEIRERTSAELREIVTKVEYKEV